ncbi:MAG: phenylacetate--CoA ligase [Eubacteriaceae bacterium]|nr:phenylacetate--CoA ligase [Eubacteriaceae bacterium]MDD4507642.1 phenylacetate--CoA ligase [Eubacteriaceae bacterium]
MEKPVKELLDCVKRVNACSPFYQKIFKDNGVVAEDVKTMDDFENLPFSEKDDLRKVYPLGLQAVPEEEVVRIHSSSGTTGDPVIIPYTAQDVTDWAIMFARAYSYAGMTNKDRIQITPGYGLWTAGIGFQAGAERLGAMVIPMGPGNTAKQIKMMQDLKSTVLASTSSYALLLAEEINRQGIRDKICLKKGIIGSERWGDKMRARIVKELGIEIYDIYGLTEVYGPGISIDCHLHCGLHYWNDYIYMEIIDPQTLKPVPEGEYGEIVITTFRKEGAPLLRYRTHDISRIIPGRCPCGSPYPRHDRILGRTDDMVKVKAVNIYPGQIEELLKDISGVSSEYNALVTNKDGKDVVYLRFEVEPGASLESLEKQVASRFKSMIGISIIPQAGHIGSLPRSEKKSVRIVDERYE